MILVSICIALNLIIYYDLITCGALAILIIGLWQKDQKKMFVNLSSFYIAVIIVIGLPLGLIKSVEPEANVPPKEVAKEVWSWMD